MAEFDRFADDYEAIIDQSLPFVGASSAHFAETKAKYVSRVLGSNFSGRMLDFGCGIGLQCTHLARHLPAATFDGFDVSESSLARVPEQLRSRGTFTSSMSELREDYDAIVVVNVLHHIPKIARQGTILQLAARLSPRGQLIIVEHNPFNLATRWVVASCPLDEGVELLRPAETRRYLRNARLVTERRDFLTFVPPRLSRLLFLESHLGWLPLGAQYATVARRR